MTDVVALADLLRRAGAVVECEVTGGSMGAAIPAGATVRIRCDGGREARAGTVIAILATASSLAVHRVVHVGRSSRATSFLLARGDANLFCDGPVRRSDVVGVVTGVRLAASDEWHPPAPPVDAAGRRFLIAALAGAMRRALEVHPWAARWCARLMLATMTPLVWLRPYARERNPVTSQLIRPAK